MPIKLNTNSGGSVTIQAPSTASGATTLTVPAVSGNVVSTGDTGTVAPAMLSTGAPSWDTNGNLTSTGTLVGSSAMTMRNRIINGDMRIDQRNSGAAVTLNSVNAPAINTFFTDRFRNAIFGQTWNTAVFSIQQTTDAPAGFYNSLKFTVSTADTSGNANNGYGFTQAIEAANLYDFNWGTTSAATVTISFWVKSSIAGTFGAAIAHFGSTTIFYPYTYSIPLANTWTFIKITVPGQTINNTPTTGNIAGVQVNFDLGSGSNIETSTPFQWYSGTNYVRTPNCVKLAANLNATFLITGVQLELGSVATPFERRPYGMELALCQRYFQKSYPQSVAPGTNVGAGSQSIYVSAAQTQTSLKSTMRVGYPTVTYYAYDGTPGYFSYYANNTWANKAAVLYPNSFDGYINFNTGSVGYPVMFDFTVSAEL